MPGTWAVKPFSPESKADEAIASSLSTLQTFLYAEQKRLDVLEKNLKRVSVTVYEGDIVTGGGGSTAWADITGTPTTLAGYGITDAVDGAGANTRLAFWTDSNTLSSSADLTWSGTGLVITGTLAASGALSASNFSGSHSGTSSGTNTGDQTITLTGNVTGSGTGSFAATIANDAVTNGKLRNSVALSVIGRSANSTGDPGDIAAGTDAHVLRRSGTTLGFGTIGDSSISDLAWSKISGKPTTLAGYGITDAVDGTGSAGQVAYWNDANTLAASANFTWNGTNFGVVGTASISSTFTLGAGLNMENAQGINMENASSVLRQVLALQSDNTLDIGGTVDGGIRFFVAAGNNAGIVSAASGWALPATLSTVGATQLGTGGNQVVVGTSSAVKSTRLEVVGGTTDTAGVLLSNTNNNSTNKEGRVKTYAYTNSQVPVTMVWGAAQSASNTLLMGGGSSAEQAMTAIEFYTASAVNTASGTLRGSFNSSGVWAVVGNSTVGGSSSVAGTHTIGGTIQSYGGLVIGPSFGVTTGVDQYGILMDSQHNSTATTSIHGIYARIQTQAAAYTIPNVYTLRIASPIEGAGSSITTNYGIKVEDQSVGGTNYAIHTGTGNILLGALAGSGSRMVVADASGGLSTQAIPTGTVTGTGASNRLALWDTATALDSDAALTYDGQTLNIGSPAAATFRLTSGATDPDGQVWDLYSEAGASGGFTIRAIAAGYVSWSDALRFTRSGSTITGCAITATDSTMSGTLTVAQPVTLNGVGGGTSSALQLISIGGATMRVRGGTSTADAKEWFVGSTGSVQGDFVIQASKDDFSVTNAAMVISRSGVTISDILLQGTTLNLKGMVGVGDVTTGINYDLTVARVNSGSTVGLKVLNEATAAGSHAVIRVETEGSSGGEPRYECDLNGNTAKWGFDPADGYFKFTSGTGTIAANTKIWSIESSEFKVAAQTTFAADVNVSGEINVNGAVNASSYGVNVLNKSISANSGGLYSFGVGAAGNANSEFVELLHTGTLGRLSVGRDGTGNYRDFAVYTSGSEKFKVPASGGATFAGGIASVTSISSGWFESGTYTATLTGCTTSPTTTVRWTRIGNRVWLDWDDVAGTSNANTMTLTGMPAGIRPTRNKGLIRTWVQNGGATCAGLLYLETSGVMNFYPEVIDTSVGGFTDSLVYSTTFVGSGTKGLFSIGICYDIT
jgi:hypothetical protein